LKNLNKALSITLLFSFLFFISACEKKASAQSEPEHAHKAGEEHGKMEHKDDHKKGDSHGDHKMATMVKVSKTGTKFEPGIAPEELPDGAWACEMGGKVHYARMEKGDGKCAICNMKLSEHHTGGDHEKGDHKADGHGDHAH